MIERIHLNGEQIYILRANICVVNEKRYTQFEVQRKHINSPLT